MPNLINFARCQWIQKSRKSHLRILRDMESQISHLPLFLKIRVASGAFIFYTGSRTLLEPGCNSRWARCPRGRL